MSFKRFRMSIGYAKAAPWPYVTTIVSLFLATCLEAAAVLCLTEEGNMGMAGALGWWGTFWLVVAFFAAADAISRYRECKRIMLLFKRYGYTERILEPLTKSRCQRDAAIFAAKRMGHGDKAKIYFHALGYRWFHILPDSVMRNPLVFLHPNFLRTSFLPGKKARNEI